MKDKNMLESEDLAALVIDESSRKKTCPIWLVSSQKDVKKIKGLSAMQAAWLEKRGWKVKAGKHALLPDEDGNIAGVIFGYDPDGGNALQLGVLPKKLPEGNYSLHGELANPEVDVLAWLLGLYRFDHYKATKAEQKVCLKLPAGVEKDRVLAMADSVYHGRDLINLPPNDLGPEELEELARALAKKFSAKIKVTVGDDLLEENFPLVHAVGRASVRAPRLIDMRWGKKGHPTLTLVGKGICFDSGGLNIKPGMHMQLMKKDMGGAAAVLTLASMIMAEKLPVFLRVIIPTAENSVSGNAFRPGDVLPSRNGMSVEIGNTDAEGRLVLADALALAEEEDVDHIVTFATLTGAARVALGVDLPPFYTTDDDFAEELHDASIKVGDPLWRMPFWAPYDGQLKSDVADVSHISSSGFAGSITAALFLKRFVNNAKHYSHFDIYGWVPASKPGKPKGGEPQGARAVFEVLTEQLFK